MNTDVARILGWTHNEYDQHDPICDIWRTPSGNRYDVGDEGPYTADDLARWLNERCPDDWVMGNGDTSGRADHWHAYAIFNEHRGSDHATHEGDPGWECEVDAAPTILEALEQLILQIGAS